MRKKTSLFLCLSLALLGMSWPAPAEPGLPKVEAPGLPQPRYQQRWFYAMHNLLVDQNVDDLIALIRRAGKAGYNGLVLADYKFNILGRMPER